MPAVGSPASSAFREPAESSSGSTEQSAPSSWSTSTFFKDVLQDEGALGSWFDSSSSSLVEGGTKKIIPPGVALPPEDLPLNAVGSSLTLLSTSGAPTPPTSGVPTTSTEDHHVRTAVVSASGTVVGADHDPMAAERIRQQQQKEESEKNARLKHWRADAIQKLAKLDLMEEALMNTRGPSPQQALLRPDLPPPGGGQAPVAGVQVAGQTKNPSWTVLTPEGALFDEDASTSDGAGAPPQFSQAMEQGALSTAPSPPPTVDPSDFREDRPWVVGTRDDYFPMCDNEVLEIVFDETVHLITGELEFLFRGVDNKTQNSPAQGGRLRNKMEQDYEGGWREAYSAFAEEQTKNALDQISERKAAVEAAAEAAAAAGGGGRPPPPGPAAPSLTSVANGAADEGGDDHLRVHLTAADWRHLESVFRSMLENSKCLKAVDDYQTAVLLQAGTAPPPDRASGVWSGSGGGGSGESSTPPSQKGDFASSTSPAEPRHFAAPTRDARTLPPQERDVPPVQEEFERTARSTSDVLPPNNYGQESSRGGGEELSLSHYVVEQTNSQSCANNGTTWGQNVKNVSSRW